MLIMLYFMRDTVPLDYRVTIIHMRLRVTVIIVGRDRGVSGCLNADVFKQTATQEQVVSCSYGGSGVDVFIEPTVILVGLVVLPRLVRLRSHVLLRDAG